MRVGSYDNKEFSHIEDSIKGTLTGNGTAIDVVYVPIRNGQVLLGEHENGIAGVKTLFQVDLGMVKWRGREALFQSVTSSFMHAFTVTDEQSAILWPINITGHTSYSGMRKLLTYFGVALEHDAVVEARAGSTFIDMLWVDAANQTVLDEYFSKLRTAAKAQFHRSAVQKALIGARRQADLLDA